MFITKQDTFIGFPRLLAKIHYRKIKRSYIGTTYHVCEFSNLCQTCKSCLLYFHCIVISIESCPICLVREKYMNNPGHVKERIKKKNNNQQTRTSFLTFSGNWGISKVHSKSCKRCCTPFFENTLLTFSIQTSSVEALHSVLNWR